MTLGIGYDLGSQTKDGIIANLTNAGMGQEQAKKIADGAGLKGNPARIWVRNNKDLVGKIDWAVIINIFNQIFHKCFPHIPNR